MGFPAHYLGFDTCLGSGRLRNAGAGRSGSSLTNVSALWLQRAEVADHMLHMIPQVAPVPGLRIILLRDIELTSTLAVRYRIKNFVKPVGKSLFVIVAPSEPFVSFWQLCAVCLKQWRFHVEATQPPDKSAHNSPYR